MISFTTPEAILTRNNHGYRCSLNYHNVYNYAQSISGYKRGIQSCGTKTENKRIEDKTYTNKKQQTTFINLTKINVKD